jgi:precorrin-6y C5,15-methyltransferase (decarboxylating) CbiE subunit
MTAEPKKILLVGCGPGAADYITPAARAAALTADVLIVSKRLAALFPESTAERIDSGTDIPGTLEAIGERRDAGKQVVVLCTGDPGIASIAQPVIGRFGRENCAVIPGISSIQVAFARFGLDWGNARVVAAHSRDPEETAAELRGADKIAVLGGRDGSLRWAAGLLREIGAGRRVFLCEELTLAGEKIREIADPGELTARPVASRAIILILDKELLA